MQIGSLPPDHAVTSRELQATTFPPLPQPVKSPQSDDDHDSDAGTAASAANDSNHQVNIVT